MFVDWWTGTVSSLGSLHVVTQSDSLTQYEKERKEQQLTSTPQQVLQWFDLMQMQLVG